MTTSLPLTELVSRVAKFSPDELLQFGADRPDELAAMQSALVEAAHDKLEQRFSQQTASFEVGPLYFLTRFTATENPQHEAQGLPFRAPFPRKTYFVPLFEAFLQRLDALFIPKSRTMMTSWGAMGFGFCDAQWRRAEMVVQTANEDKCIHLIDYVRQLWDNQEAWVKERHPLMRRSSFSIAWEGGGEVASIPSGADKIRAFHPTTYVMDEAAYLPEGEECLNAVRPTGARIIAISSAHAGWFGDQCAR